MPPTRSALPYHDKEEDLSWKASLSHIIHIIIINMHCQGKLLPRLALRLFRATRKVEHTSTNQYSQEPIPVQLNIHTVAGKA